MSGTALAAGVFKVGHSAAGDFSVGRGTAEPAASAWPLSGGKHMNDFLTYFITWTTYGTWLPGDARGWRKTKKGDQPPQPLLEEWCRNRMSESPVLMNAAQRDKVEAVCRKHAEIRGWILHAVNVRSNHVHLAVTADKKPELVRDQFKANATRVLRQEPDVMKRDKIWTRGGDCEVVDDEDNLARVVEYIMEAQDRMDRGK